MNRPNWHAGNAAEDAPAHRGWLLGHFIEPGDIRSTTDLEVKWGVHPAGEHRESWVEDEKRTTLVLLVAGGPFRVEFKEGAALLERHGDYVLYGRLGHSWRALNDATVLTVRWPSIP